MGGVDGEAEERAVWTGSGRRERGADGLGAEAGSVDGERWSGLHGPASSRARVVWTEEKVAQTRGAAAAAVDAAAGLRIAWTRGSRSGVDRTVAGLGRRARGSGEAWTGRAVSEWRGSGSASRSGAGSGCPLPETGGSVVRPRAAPYPVAQPGPATPGNFALAARAGPLPTPSTFLLMAPSSLNSLEGAERVRCERGSNFSLKQF